jgi:hypothetical protein
MNFGTLFVFIIAVPRGGTLSLPQIYQSNMVLQRAPYKSRIWGYSNQDNARVSLTLYGKNYASQARKVDWNELPVWHISLDPVIADNKPVDIEITETDLSGTMEKLVLKNVLFGDGLFYLAMVCLIVFF